jgi:Na+-driven multidrug efflux pump
VLGVLGVLFVVFADVVVGWFTQDPAIGGIATRGLRIISAGFPFYAAGYVLTQSFNGAGDTMTPTLINLGCFWMLEIPLAYVLGRTLGYGPQGVFWAMAFSFSVMSVVSALLFRRGRWKMMRV